MGGGREGEIEAEAGRERGRGRERERERGGTERERGTERETERERGTERENWSRNPSKDKGVGEEWKYRYLGTAKDRLARGRRGRRQTARDKDH